MRVIRAVLAIAACSVVLLAGTGVASAGGSPATSSVTTTCDPDTGIYDIALILTSRTDETLTLLSGSFTAFSINDERSGTLTFAPDPLPAGETSTATFKVLGTTTEVFVEWKFRSSRGDFLEDRTVSIEEPCTVVPTTATTAPATTVPGAPTTTAPAAAAAAVASPRFTG